MSKNTTSFLKILMIAAACFLFFGMILSNHKESSTAAEAAEISDKVMDACGQQVLGHKQQQGEVITEAQSSRMIKCEDAMASVYLENKAH